VNEDIKECYRLLGVEPGASTEGIRKAYLELVKMWHPDLFEGDPKFQQRATNKTKTINLAYEKLCAYVSDRNAAIEVAHGRITDIEASQATPASKLRRVLTEVIPLVEGLANTQDASSERFTTLSDRLIQALRSIATAGSNDCEDIETALAAITRACALASDKEMADTLTAEKETIVKAKWEHDRYGAQIQCGEPGIRFSKEAVTYTELVYGSRWCGSSHALVLTRRPTVLPIDDINGVQYGVLTEPFMEKYSLSTFHLALSSCSHGKIHLEYLLLPDCTLDAVCSAILDSLYHYVVPVLSERVARSVLRGTPYQLGDILLTAEGVRATFGRLFWKKERLAPWSSLRTELRKGHIRLSSTEIPRFSRSLSLLSVWNAALLPDIVCAINHHQSGVESPPPIPQSAFPP